jgi:DNA-binding MarR family transcriptional regulator
MTTNYEAVRRSALPSRWRPVRELFGAMDRGIAEVYAGIGVRDVRPRFTMALIFLERGEMTIRQLAREVDVTHSAMSQTVSAMRAAGLVESIPGPDARSRIVALTAAGRDLVPVLRAEWAATEKAIAELEDEVPYPLTQVVGDLEAALRRRPFAERITAHLELPTR